MLTEIRRQRDKQSKKPPQSLYKQFEVVDFLIGGFPCYRLMPKDGLSGKYIFYVYSSFLIREPDPEEWNFVGELLQKTGAVIYVPMYPLLPEYGCRDVFSMLGECYSKTTQDTDIRELTLMGAGVGGGLALSLAIMAWKQGYKKPDRLVLLSPSLDTEFFDERFYRELCSENDGARRYYMNDGIRDFLNTAWVRDYAVKTEYTSPFYEDYTDLCDDVCIFSGTEDNLNCYAREFYKKAKQQGLNVRFYELEGEGHGFMIYDKTRESRKAKGFLMDVLNGTYTDSETLFELYPVKLMAEWSKHYPKVFRDDWAEKFTYDHKFDFSGIRTRMSQTANLRLAANFFSCDALVKTFITEYPDGTVVNVGCRLGNAFGRVDNGKILWYSVDTHNIMSIRRAMYGDRPREKTIGRNIMDFSWLDEIECNRYHGVMFVFNGTLTYMNKNKVRLLLDRIKEKFPGAQITFTASNSGATFLENLHKTPNLLARRRRGLYVDDADKLFADWSIDYRVMSVEPTSKYLGMEKKDMGWYTRLCVKYNKLSLNHKIIRVKLGAEAYDVIS